MPAKIKAYPKPTNTEMEILRRYLRLQDWHFKGIKERSIEICSYPICWDRGTKDYKLAWVYGLRGVKGADKEPCIANIFIRYEQRLYQTEHLIEATQILQLLSKEHLYDDYSERLEDIRWEKRQKLLAERKKSKRL